MPPVLGLAAAALLAAAPAGAASRARVPAGTVQPVYKTAQEKGGVEVGAFLLDRYPVTNAQFLAFVKQHPKWRRDRVKALFADDQYLAQWGGPTELGPLAPPNAPVTRVSWFAARAYCRAHGGRLPTENEWELAAQAGSDVPGFQQRILAWFGQPTPKVLPDVGHGPANPLGIHDLHGLVWEWVDDFANTIVTGDSRDSGDPNRLRFCGAAAIGASDKFDYAAFMRVAFRSSLQARYTVANLGFRCAADLPGAAP